MRRGHHLSTPLPRRRVNCRAAIINFVRRYPGKARAIGGEVERREDGGSAGGGRKVDARRDVTVHTSMPRFEMSSRFDEKDKTRKRPSRK